jgi:hypothetical protein
MQRLPCAAYPAKSNAKEQQIWEIRDARMVFVVAAVGNADHGQF